MSVISINVIIFKTNKPPSHKVLKQSDKSYSATELLLPLGGIKVVIHGIIMIVSFVFDNVCKALIKKIFRWKYVNEEK